MPSDTASDDVTLHIGPASSVPASNRIDVPPGSLLDRYAVIEEIGRGGMGVVVRAYDPKLRREVALKVVRTGSADAEARLVREAQAMAQLSHPNVVAVYDVAVRDPGAQSQVVLAMEYVAGTDLADWLSDRERPAAEILEAFVAAGRGLAAAHAEGLLHRDFKPANILVGDDGRIRVTDFGLARLDAVPTRDSESAVRSTSSERDSASEPLTEQGTVMGTPRYMAPEQHVGDELTAAADQYALCISLWEALAGEPPFVGTGHALLHAKLQGPPAFPRRGTVPGWVLEALARGLSPKADDRFPSVAALLDRLAARAPNRARVWMPGLVVVGALSFAAWTGARSDDSAHCTGSEQQLAEVWPEDRRDAVADAFARSELAFAADVWERTEAEIDAWTQAWVAMHRDTCEATQLRGEQSTAVMDLRMACLQRARLDLDAVAHVLEDATPAVIERAHRVVGRLPQLSRCEDIEALQADVVAPSDEQAPAVEKINAQLALALAQREAADFDAALETAQAAESAAEEVDYEPVKSEVFLVLSDIHEGTAKYEDAEAAAREAIAMSTRLGQTDAQRRASLRLMSILGMRMHKPEEALVLAELAEALSMDTPRHEAFYRGNLASVLRVAGRYDEAETEQLRVIELTRELLEEGDPGLATPYMNLGVTYFHQGRYDESEKLSRQSLDLAIKAHGRNHPAVARAMLNIANSLFELGRYEDSAAQHREALTIFLETVGEAHPETAATYSNLAGAYFHLGKIDESLEALKKSTDARIATLGPRHVEVGNSRHNLAAIYHRAGRQHDALAEYQGALDIYLEKLGPEHPLVMTAQQNMANVHLALGRFEKAERIYRDAYARQVESLGADHADTIRTRFNLAAALNRLGRSEEAEGIFREVLAQRIELLGPDHDGVAQVYANLANAISAQGGRSAEAEEAQRTALEARLALYGAEHEDVGLSRHNLASILHERGDHDGALVEEEEALRVFLATLGAEHLWVAEAQGGLGKIRHALGQREGAEQAHRKAVEIAELSDDDHPVLGERLVGLGSFLLDRGRQKDALPVLERAWSIAERRPDTSEERAVAAFALARALPSDPEHRARAVELAGEARRYYESAGSARAERMREVDAWIARHGI